MWGRSFTSHGPPLPNGSAAVRGKCLRNRWLPWRRHGLLPCPFLRPCVRRLLSKLLIRRAPVSRASCRASPPVERVPGRPRQDLSVWSLHHLPSPHVRLHAFPYQIVKNRSSLLQYCCNVVMYRSKAALHLTIAHRGLL